MADIRYQIAIDERVDNSLTEEATAIDVQQTIEGPTTFRVRFDIDICDGDFELLEDERLTPGRDDITVSILAFIDDASHVLVHGLITERRIGLVEGGPGSFLEIVGQDRRALMARERRTASHTGRASDVVTRILRSYDFSPDVADTEIQYEEDGNTLNQTGDDLGFVTRLAARNDARFWLTWSATRAPSGLGISETAHFRPSPPRRQGPGGQTVPVLLAPQLGPSLRLNSGDGCSNVESFELSSTFESPNQSGRITRINASNGQLEVTEVASPTTPPLGSDALPQRTRTRQLVTAGGAQEARIRTQAAINDASWAVQATAQTSVHALLGIPAPHDVIRVTGGGRLNSGDYFVKAVSHTIDPSNHKLRIELLRNALGHP